jgi:hypothetical protein
MSRDELLTKLLAALHLSVEERRGLGGRVTRHEVASVILKGLREHGHFPPDARPWTAGQVCFEGWQLVSLSSGARLLAQRRHPLSPTTLAESTVEDFQSDEEAVAQYVLRAVGRSVDGVTVD